MNQPNLFDLTGKIAVVTGGSRGIGEAIAKALAAYGAHVIVTSRKAQACARVVEDIVAEGSSAEAYACHIGEMDQIDALYDHLQAQHGRLDILVNNAATNPYFGPIYETDAAAFQKTVDVNIRGYFFMSSHAARLMAKNGGGSIVNIASVNAVVPGPMQGIYSITKAAIVCMTRAFAKECAPLGVRVNAILPGITDTKFSAAIVHTSDESLRKAMLDSVPMRRIAEPDEIAGAALYLVSPSASYTTGACLAVDGGYLTA